MANSTTPRSSRRSGVQICTQGHLPFAAGALAVYETLKALREGVAPKDLKGVPSADFVNRYMRNGAVQQRMADFLGDQEGLGAGARVRTHKSRSIDVRYFPVATKFRVSPK